MITRAPYDAVLVVSFGGPEGPDEVIPFLENVTRGRGVPRDRLDEVAEQYLRFGGVSPLPAHDRRLVELVGGELDRQGFALPVYLGNRNWRPLLADTLARMRDDGVERALAFVTSAYSSYSGCRQYREDIDAARFAVGPGAPEVHKLRAFHNHPGFIDPFVDGTRGALDELSGARLVFTAHSVPMSMAASSDYVDQLTDSAGLIADRVGRAEWDLVWQSRSGPPQVPWLEPDIGDHLRNLADRGVDQVVIVPLGFVADHQEVRFDLDTQAREIADGLGMAMRRVATPGHDDRYLAMIADLVAERMEGRQPQALGDLGPRQDVCGVGCCPRPPRPGRPR